MNLLEYGIERSINRSIICRNRCAHARRLLRMGNAWCDKFAESARLRVMFPFGQLLDGKPLRIGIDEPSAILAKP